ncbi:MAG TPA: hypothetical protein PLY32_04220 [Salinivirgaceae bacterium]|nr:hypothetical protein [Salinivirgaceae bacterium]
MKKLYFIFLTILPLFILGQTPLWTKDAFREESYPADTWYTGFVYTQLSEGVDISEALKGLEREAQNQMTESIMLKIESETKYQERSTTHGGSEILSSDFKQDVRASASAIMVKSEVKSYYAPATNMAYAFAAVRRSDLADYYKSQISLNLTRVDAALVHVNQLIESGKKINAREQCKTVGTMLDSLDYYQNLLTAIDSKISNSDLQIERTDNLRHKVNQYIIDLEHSTLVYVSCKHEFRGGEDDAFSEDPCIMCDIIKQALSENGCSVIDNPDNADYELLISTSTSLRSAGSGQYGVLSYYANVKGTLYNKITNKKTADFTFFNDPAAYSTGRTPADAATKAFRLPALKNKVLEKILSNIN